MTLTSLAAHPSDLDDIIRRLLPVRLDKRERRGRPRSMIGQARTIDHAVWALAFEETLSLGEARRRVAKEHGLHPDHIRKLQRLALIVYVDDIVESQLEERLLGTTDDITEVAQKRTT